MSSLNIFFPLVAVPTYLPTYLPTYISQQNLPAMLLLVISDSKYLMPVLLFTFLFPI